MIGETKRDVQSVALSSERLKQELLAQQITGQAGHSETTVSTWEDKDSIPLELEEDTLVRVASMV